MVGRENTLDSVQFSKWGASGGRSSSVGRRKDHYLRGRTTKIR